MVDVLIVDLRQFGFVSRFLGPSRSSVLSQRFAAIHGREATEIEAGIITRYQLGGMVAAINSEIGFGHTQHPGMLLS